MVCFNHSNISLRNELSLIYGYINQKGDEVISLKYGRARDFSEGLAWVFDASFNGFVDKTGTPVINLSELDYTEAGNFSEGLVNVGGSEDTDYKWGFIDKTGKKIIDLEFSFTSSFSNGLAAVVNDEGKWGYISNPLVSTGKSGFRKQFSQSFSNFSTSPLFKRRELITIEDFRAAKNRDLQQYRRVKPKL